jgi:glycosyltransferase involved in cell wall biosynthesis
MSETPDITLILPAYNEASIIEQTITETVGYFTARRWHYEIIVAADGDDGTRELVAGLSRRDPRIRVIGQPERRGKGRGIREAVAIARGNVIGYADADNKVSIREIEKVDPWLQQGYEVVIGSRGCRGSLIEQEQPWYRRIGSKGFYVFLHSLIGLPGVRDTQCGFKFFPASVAKHLFAIQTIDGYMFDIEILVLAQRLGYRIKEVPIRWHDDGDSRLELLRGNIRNVRDVWQIRRRTPNVPLQRAAAAGQVWREQDVPRLYESVAEAPLDHETEIG